MSFANSVTIGPQFFSKAFNDYSNKYWAFAREILQNSIDCGSTEINISVVVDLSGGTIVTVINDGEPMSSDVLVNKLLSLGASGKDFKGSVGGFGKAKEILYFAHRSYVIVTGGLHVSGSGAGYNLEQAAVPQDGTLSQVIWDGNHADSLVANFKRFIELCRPGILFTLNGNAIQPKLATGTLNRTLDRDENPWAEVRLSQVEENLLVVRMGGIPMFHRRTEFKGTVCIELLGTSAERLTSNRDGLLWSFSDQLNAFITSIAIDKKTVFKLEKAEYKRFRGTKLRRPSKAKVAAYMEAVKQFAEILKPAAPAQGPVVQAPAPQQAPAAPGRITTTALVTEPAPMGGAGILVEVVGQTEAPNPLGHEFLIKNCVRRAVPAEFDPATFSDHAKWLAKAWAGCLVELHAIYDIDHQFSVGFLFSEDIEAEHETSEEYGRVYFLNPCKVSKEKSTRRYKKTDRFALLALVAHEFVHGLGFSYHDESYASKLTEVMAVVLKNGRRFSAHLS